MQVCLFSAQSVLGRRLVLLMADNEIMFSLAVKIEINI